MWSENLEILVKIEILPWTCDHEWLSFMCDNKIFCSALLHLPWIYVSSLEWDTWACGESIVIKQWDSWGKWGNFSGKKRTQFYLLIRLKFDSRHHCHATGYFYYRSFFHLVINGNRSRRENSKETKCFIHYFFPWNKYNIFFSQRHEEPKTSLISDDIEFRLRKRISCCFRSLADVDAPSAIFGMLVDVISFYFSLLYLLYFVLT